MAYNAPSARRGKQATGFRRINVGKPKPIRIKWRNSVRPNKPKARRPPARPMQPRAKLQGATKRKLDPALAKLCRCVLDPFTGPLSVGLVPGGPNVTAVCRRTSNFSFSITGGNVGTDAFIVLNGARDPYMYAATGGATDFTTKTVKGYGLTSDSATSYTLPLGSTARVISAGIKLECMGRISDLGGMVYHFPYNPDLVGTTTQPTNVWGSPLNALQTSTSHSRIGASPLNYIESPNFDFRSIQSYPDASWATGLPAALDQVDGIRLLFTGIAPGITLTYMISISEVVEFYHDTIKHFATSPQTHTNGLAVHEALRVALTEPGSDASNPAAPGFMARMAKGLSNALGFAVDAAGFYMKNSKSINLAASNLAEGLMAIL